MNPSAREEAALQAAAANGHIEIVKTLLQREEAVITAKGNLAVRMAFTQGHKEIVDLLMQNEQVRQLAVEQQRMRKQEVKCEIM